MIDLECEECFPIRELPKHLPKRHEGKPIHIATAYRWISRGVRGTKLEIIRIGGIVYTSTEAIQRFAERCSTGDLIHEPLASRRRETELARANKQLDELGI